jgi:hypothetical protein
MHLDCMNANEDIHIDKIFFRQFLGKLYFSGFIKQISIIFIS